jgi:hypothetical protein
MVASLPFSKQRNGRVQRRQAAYRLWRHAFRLSLPPPQIEQKCCLANASSARGETLNKKLKYAAAAIVVFATVIYINNTNHLATHRDGKPILLAHRGIAQRFDERARRSSHHRQRIRGVSTA